MPPTHPLNHFPPHASYAAAPWSTDPRSRPGSSQVDSTAASATLRKTPHRQHALAIEDLAGPQLLPIQWLGTSL